MILQTSGHLSFLEGNGPTLIVLALFILLSLAAGGLSLLIGRFLFKLSSFRFYGSLLFAMLGGIMGIFMHIYATRYLSMSRDPDASSLISMFSVFSVFTFINMLTIPLLAMALISKNKKIRALKEELKNQTRV